MRQRDLHDFLDLDRGDDREQTGVDRALEEILEEKPINPIETIELPLDHFGSTTATFRNRFTVDTSLYKPGGPVILDDSGEAAAFREGKLHVLKFRHEQARLHRTAKELGGIMILWEHRFYGESTLYSIDSKTPASAFQFLTTEQALADVAYFAWNFSRTELPSVDLTPAGTPWVFIGGSYPGMRAAFMRKFYPETIQASLASSAPVQARVDMSVYFDMIWRGMQAAGYQNCSRDIKAAIDEIDKQLDDSKTASIIKQKFFGLDAGKNSNEGFADALSTVFNSYQSFGLSQLKDAWLGGFCEWISRDPVTNQTAPAAGWASEKGPQFTIERWATWRPFADLVNENMETQCRGREPFKKKGITYEFDCNFDKPSKQADKIAWTWQYCTQWGYFQSANLGERQLISKYNSLEHQRKVCHRQFPDGRSSGFLPDWPEVDKTNGKLGGWNMTVSNVLWTNGELDPWRTLGVMSDEDFGPKFTTNHEIPDCDCSTRDGDNVFGYLIPGAQHCFDLVWGLSYAAAADPARDLWLKAAENWLKCWQPAVKKPGEKSKIPGGPVRMS